MYIYVNGVESETIINIETGANVMLLKDKDIIIIEFADGRISKLDNCGSNFNTIKEMIKPTELITKEEDRRVKLSIADEASKIYRDYPELSLRESISKASEIFNDILQFEESMRKVSEITKGGYENERY